MNPDFDFSIANNETILVYLGSQIRNIRLARNISQAQLAEEAGVTTLTINRLEKGLGTTLDTFIRVLIALGIQQNLTKLLPDPTIRPMERISESGTERQRARPRKTNPQLTGWAWGEDQENHD